jgi:dienelactone hydrolase
MPRRHNRTRPVRTAVLTGSMVALLVTLVAACGGPSSMDAGSASAGTSTRSATPLPTREPTRSVAERCYVDVPGEVVDIPGADAPSSLGAVAYGHGRTAVVLLHQTGHGGLCGWVTYARWVGSQGVLAVAVDDCGYGASRCTEQLAGDTRAMVALAVDWARSQGATRVAVVGASMGGARALGVGQAAGADVVVDLSGPTHWEGVPDAVAAARMTTVPLLVISADGDRGIPGDELAAAVAASPAPVKEHLRIPGSAHGWNITMDGIAADARVTHEGRLVLDWATGRAGG